MLKQLKQIDSKKLEQILSEILSNSEINWTTRNDLYDVPYPDTESTIKALKDGNGHFDIGSINSVIVFAKNNSTRYIMLDPQTNRIKKSGRLDKEFMFSPRIEIWDKN